MYSERYVPLTIVLAFREHKIVCNIGFFGNKHETKKTCSTFQTQNGKDFEKRQYIFTDHELSFLSNSNFGTIYAFSCFMDMVSRSLYPLNFARKYRNTDIFFSQFSRNRVPPEDWQASVADPWHLGMDPDPRISD